MQYACAQDNGTIWVYNKWVWAMNQGAPRRILQTGSSPLVRITNLCKKFSSLGKNPQAYWLSLFLLSSADRIFWILHSFLVFYPLVSLFWFIPTMDAKSMGQSTLKEQDEHFSLTPYESTMVSRHFQLQHLQPTRTRGRSMLTQLNRLWRQGSTINAQTK